MRFIILFFLSVFAFSIEIQKPKIYKGDENIQNWVMSEKLDGIRGFWDGENLLTRKGKKLYPPKWFINTFHLLNLMVSFGAKGMILKIYKIL